MFRYLTSLALFCLAVFPVGIPGVLVAMQESNLARMILILLFPSLSIVIYTAICLIFARLGMKAIIPGRFPRQLDHVVYGRRRLYGTMWTAIYYFKPLYWFLLSTRTTKTMLLRGFGYKGSIDMVTYPDTWIRDLPLLEVADGAYLANKSTIGTNMCLSDGTILVDRVKIGKSTVIGHLCMLAPGVEIGEHSETGSGSALGMGVKLGNKVKVGPHALVNHGAKIANEVVIGTSSHIGIKVIINAEGLVVPSFAFIPDFAVINNETDLKLIMQQRTASNGL